VVGKGIVETAFEFDHVGERVPGILWRPDGSSGPTPMVLLGHGGTQHKRTPGVLSLARRLARHLDYASVAIDAPGHGDRREGPEERVAPAEMRRRVAAMTPEQAAAAATRNAGAAGEWAATLDAIERTDGVHGPFGYWGVSMGTGIGLPFVSSEPRVTAAVFGLAGVGNRAGSERLAEAAQKVAIPVLFLFQWDDELIAREHGLALYDAFGSAEKTMHINPGGHIEMPAFERDAVEAFFARHLRRPAG